MEKKQAETTSSTEVKTNGNKHPVPQNNNLIEGTTVIEDEVVAAIAGFAASKAKGVESLGKTSFTGSVSNLVKSTEDKARTGVEVEVGKKEAIINIEVGVTYGFYIPEIVSEIRKNVAAALMESTGLVAKEINIRVVSIKFTDSRKTKS